jgi:NAD(P)-dependent dehydrogenase (short-subunit alcohol dehydrogenase family)
MVQLAMARIFISGSADGLGLMAGQSLLEHGHAVTSSQEAKAQQPQEPTPGIFPRGHDEP